MIKQTKRHWSKPMSLEGRNRISKTRLRLFSSGLLTITKQARKKISNANKGHKVSLATRKLISLAHKGKNVSLSTRQKISRNHANFCGKKNPFYGKHHTLAFRRKISAIHLGNKYCLGRKFKHSFKTKEKLRALWRSKRNWIASQVLKGLKLKPNKPEKILTSLLHRILPQKYKYVGNGTLLINGFNPDFVNKKDKKIIELYGDYWHLKPDSILADKRRVKTYKKFGYKLLVIWEHELKNINNVISKIQKFEKKEE